MTMYYIARPGGEKQGPFPESTVRANLLHEGHYAADTLAWCKGMEGWKPLREVFGRKDGPAPAAPAKPAAAPAPKAQVKYFIAERGGKAQGPYTLYALLKLGYACTPHTLAWHKGMKDWEPIARVPGLGLLATQGVQPELAPPAPRTFRQYLFPPFTRATRTEFFASAFCAAVTVIAVIPALMAFADRLNIEDFMGCICLALFLLCVVHMFLQSARRLHDIGFSAASLIFFAIPLIGWIPFAITALLPGSEGKNDYGPSPRKGIR